MYCCCHYFSLGYMSGQPILLELASSGLALLDFAIFSLCPLELVILLRSWVSIIPFLAFKPEIGHCWVGCFSNNSWWLAGEWIQSFKYGLKLWYSIIWSNLNSLRLIALNLVHDFVIKNNSTEHYDVQPSAWFWSNKKFLSTRMLLYVSSLFLLESIFTVQMLNIFMSEFGQFWILRFNRAWI